MFAASLADDASPAARKQFTDAYTQALQSGARVPVSGTFTLYPARTMATGTAAASMIW